MVRRHLFEGAMQTALRLIALIVILVSGVWAQPKFKVLATVPGGLWSGVSFDAKGNLYGATTGGGTQNKGTIFELSPGAHGWTLSTIHNFDGYDGGGGNGGLIFDEEGNMFGTSPSGGAHNGGNVFEMTHGSGDWTFSDLYDFCPEYHCPDGSAPEAGVALGEQGQLYGTASAGGQHSGGAIFELTGGSSGWEENVLYTFCSEAYCHDGEAPIAGVTPNEGAGFFGTTFVGGAYGGGSVFRLKRASGGVWKEIVLYSFCSAGFPQCKDGMRPYAGVVFDGLGNLYGTTEQGGGNTCGETTCGTIFKLTPTRGGGWKHTVLYAFPDPGDGSFPTGGVIMDKAGNLYGATVGGGIGGFGVVYKLAPQSGGKWKYTVLHKFDGSDGGQPLGGLIFDGKGSLYGTAYNVVFEITP